MELIPLTKGLFASVDDADFEALSKFKWHAHWNKRAGKFYAASVTPMINRVKGKMIRMHRIVLCLTDPSVYGDHINGDTLDNRRENLRAASNSQNQMNRQGANKNSTTGLRGVYKKRKGFASYITLSGKLIYIGTFKTKEDAANAYATENRKNFGAYGGVL